MTLITEQKQKIKRLAQREGTTAKEAILRLVDEAFSAEQVTATPGSFLDGIEDLVGSIEGPSDLSQNPKHMEGYGR